MCRSLTMFFIALVLVACTTSPTGRKQLIMFSDQQLGSMGASAFENMKSTIPLSGDAATRSYVNCVTDRVLSAMGQNPAEWEVVVFAQPQINAFALPGKKIGVYEGIFQAAVNQHMLAAVIGHEIGHVTARHGNERMSAGAATNMGLKVVEMVGRTQGVTNPQVYAAIGLGAEYGIVKPYGRSHESEADLIGLRYMSQAGFDPRQSVGLWQNMAALNQNAPPEFLSTHPSARTRINDLQKAIPSVMGLYNGVANKPRCAK